MTTLSDLNIIKEDEEESFIKTSLLTASREGTVSTLVELLSSFPTLDLNASDKLGMTPIHYAAAEGHADVIRFLHATRNSLVNSKDQNGDEPIHWAARQGQISSVECLRDLGYNLSAQNKREETALHIAARYNHVEVVHCLCSFSSSSPSSSTSTQLLNLTEKHGYTALHIACRHHHISSAMLLLGAGCNLDIQDRNQETALHPACRLGLLSVVQSMCARGCRVDIVNRTGFSPIHVAAKAGQTEVVRSLLLSGTNVDLPNEDGVSSELIAIAHGRPETADLLARLKPEKHGVYIKQLLPTQDRLKRIKVKVLGSSGVGKTTIINTLSCGYLSGLLRNSYYPPPTPPHQGATDPRRVSTDQISTVTAPVAGTGTATGAVNGMHHQATNLRTHIQHDLTHPQYTRGIHVRQMTLSGAGDTNLFSFWEFSGYEPYYLFYDLLIGDLNCVHLVVFSLADSADTQLTQILFWLNFIKARIQPAEPIGYAGSLPCRARVMLIGTHLDKTTNIPPPLSSRGGVHESSELNGVLERVRLEFTADLDIHPRIVLVESHTVRSAEMKYLRLTLGQFNSDISQVISTGNGFLDATIAALPAWRRVVAKHPVVTWTSFVEYIHSIINILASEGHLKQVMYQLQLMGEVVYIETSGDDYVILDPQWLCSSVIGQLLSYETTKTLRPTGCFKLEDFQHQFPDFELEDLLSLLEALQVSTRCEVDDGDVEYELPCLNYVETLSGLWDLKDKRLPDGVYGGIRLTTAPPMRRQLMHIFPRIQVHMRRDYLSGQSDLDSDLYQWYHGSKFCRGALEALVMLVSDDEVIEVKCRGPREVAAEMYYFLEDIADIITNVTLESCPGLCLERRILSAAQLRAHNTEIYAYNSRELILAQLNDESSVRMVRKQDEQTETRESIVDLVTFSCAEILASLQRGIDLHVTELLVSTRRLLSYYLDPAHPIGCDWCMVALSLGLSSELPLLDMTSCRDLVISKTDNCLALWAQNPAATIGTLLSKLIELGREDAAEVILTSVPLYRSRSASLNKEVAAAANKKTAYDDRSLGSS